MNPWNLMDDQNKTVEKSNFPEFIPKRTVESADNHVYFYADVNSDRCLALIQEVKNVDRFLRGEHISRSLPDDHPRAPIWLHISSYGGSVFSALAVSDQLKRIVTPVFSIVEGCCASAATLISMACARRFITPSSFMLIHQVSSLAWGTYEQLQDEMNLLDMMMDVIAKFYAKHSGVSADEVRELLRRDTWFSAQQCLERGMVDVIQDNEHA